MGVATSGAPTISGGYHLSSRRQVLWLTGLDVVAIFVFAWLWDEYGVVVEWAGLLLLVGVRWRMGLYLARFHLSALDELPRALHAGLVTSGIFALGGLYDSLGVSTIDVVLLSAAWLTLALMRFPTYVMLRVLRRRDVARERLLLVGGGVVAGVIADLAEDNPDYGLDLAGRVPNLLELDLPRAAADAGASTVLVAFSRASEAREVFEIRRGLAAGLTILAVPRYFDLIGENRADDEVFGVPVVRLGTRIPTFGLAVKRVVDTILAGLAMIVLGPILLLAGWLVTRETGGEMLFRQVRIGQGGEPFELLKLQTMKPVPEDVSDTLWGVTPDSERLGPVGAFLRKTSIDELPQLWNILRGDMSFVGPRPERPFFVEQFSGQYPHYQDRMRMPAGLTGLAQIYDLRGDTSIDDRARFDNRYLDNWSLWMDIKIILKTIPKVLKGSGG